VKPRVVIADDHPAFVLGLRLGLESEGFDVVGSAFEAEAAVSLTISSAADAVVLDVRMPGRSGIEACRDITLRLPSVAAVMLSTYDDAVTRNNARMAGARAFLTKETPPHVIAETLRRLIREPRLVLLPEPEVPRLTEREIDVLRGLGSGRSNKEIAIALGISPETVKDRCSSIFAKLVVMDRTQAVLEAQRLGLLDEGWPPRMGVLPKPKMT
jgi:two-component system, NarL family, nitrate/nitrite response regulator NarL